MLFYIGIDDTDTLESAKGTGRLAREFAASLNGGAEVIGVVRHQLPRLEGVPYTSNNSSACVVVESANGESAGDFAERAAAFVLDNFVEGSDPGVCAAAADTVAGGLVDFALDATGRLMDQKAAVRAAGGTELAGLGGTNDGIIGAAAAVGLTAYGWCGRFIEYGRLRELSDPLTVGDLEKAGIMAVSVDRDPLVPRPGDMIESPGWIRPSLWNGRPVLQVVGVSPGVWRTAHSKRRKKTGA
jgi:tRNA(Ile2) C34 agmatinyltransferase TiaS